MNYRRTKIRTWGRLAIGVVLAGSMAVATGGMAQANQPTHHNSVEIPINNLHKTSVLGPNTILVGKGATSTGITLPGKATRESQLDPSEVPDALFDGVGGPITSTVLPSASVTSYKTETGMQTLIKIDSSAAASDYRFPLTLPEDSTVQVEPDGSVSVKDQFGGIVGKYLSPWAIDANGNSVKTSFSIQGNSLVQTVSFDANTMFPVVADPQWWQTALSATAGAAAGAAIVAGIPGVGLTVGAIAGGCVTGAMNAMWDGANFWGGFRACLFGAAIGFIAGAAGNIVRTVLARYGVGV